MRRGGNIAYASVAGSAHAVAWTLPQANTGRSERREGLVDAELARTAFEVRTALQEAAVAAEAAAARALSVAEVLGEALAILEQVGGRAAPPAPVGRRLSGTDLLSPREREVLALVVEGRSNKAIAEALFVSPNTVKTHVASLMTKLDASTRAHLAAIAARQGCA